MPIYRIYGLTIASELECPLLLSSDDAADISIRFERIPAPYIPDDLHAGANIVGAGKVLLNIEEVAKFLISDGKEVLIEPYPNVGTEHVRIFLLGSALGILLLQRGLLPLHGCGIVHNNAAVLFLGNSGIGKSTLAEAFRRKGYPLLTDDVSALSFASDSSVNVFPAYPKINLMAETAEMFNIQTEGLAQAHNKKIKFAVPVAESFCAEPKPLARIYILHRALDSGFHLERPAKIASIPFLARNTYRKQIIEKMGFQQRHIEQCANLASNYPVSLLSRPDDLSLLPELVNYLESDFR